MPPEIIYSDDNLIVINKPPGISVHGGGSVRGPTVADFLLDHFPEIKNVGDPSIPRPKGRDGGPEGLATSSGQENLRPGIVHRLDKDTSGVMAVARNQKSFEELKKLFQNRRVEKVYHAIVCGRPRHNSGIVSLPMGRKVKNPTLRGVEDKKSKIRGAREAVTKYRVLKRGEKYSLLELHPQTGRMHQLRVHLKSIGHPVACDKLYGGKNVCCPQGANRQLLHAKSLSFSFPEGRRMFFEADPPKDFAIAERGIL